jgi:hypothetical protein
MRFSRRAILCSFAALLSWPLCAQDIAPREYAITPVNSNAVIFTYSFFDGGLNFNGAVPITNPTGMFSIPIFSVYHSSGVFGRSANFTASLPYGVGTFQGELVGTHRQIYRSGLVDFNALFSVNLMGG